MIPPSTNNGWLTRRNRGLHMTIRDVDCANFDVQRFIRDLQDMHVTFFSFFVGGYVTTYPTRLEYQRVSPYLNDRDLAGEIFDAARAAGIKTLAMIDTGQLPAHAAEAHPEWAVRDSSGQMAVSTTGIYLACPLGGYQRAHLREMVAEILGRYRPDCMKFGGSSFGFPRRICYCDTCRADFLSITGFDLPPETDRAHPTWEAYDRWRHAHTRRRAVELKEIVRAVDPDMPVMGNGVCFGDPGWTLNAGLDIEHIAQQHDAVQVEIQSRARYDPNTAQAEWQWLSWPAETAKMMTTVSNTPIWVVASYFLAWPWRRSAMPAAEQKVYLAQVAANGADPMVNLSGGPPAVHEDPRGFQAIRDLYGFLDKHQAYYQDDRSAANVAVLYSLETLRRAGLRETNGAAEAQHYVDELRGWQQALHAAHIPFDILSTASLSAEALARYRAVVLPGTACLSEDNARLLREYHAGGGGLAASYLAGVYDEDGRPRETSLLSDVLGAQIEPRTLAVVDCPEPGYAQAYMVRAADHPVLDGLDGVSLFPAAGRYCPAQPASSADVPLTLSASFIVFPEGLSYPKQPASGAPQLICQDAGKGRSVYFPAQAGLLAQNLRYPDHAALLANAVRWAAHDHLPVRVEAPPGLQITLRTQPGRRLLHLINLAGTRLFARPIPLHDIRVSLPAEPGRKPARAFLLSDGKALEIQQEAAGVRIAIPRLVDYDVLVVE